MTLRGRTRKTIIAVSFVLGSTGAGLLPPVGAATDVTISVSLFRYCLDDVCTPDRFGYVRARSSAPLPPEADNPRGIIDVRRGDTVTWIYNDPFCDFQDGEGDGPSPIFCPGHNVIFEDGSVISPLMRARQIPADTFSWTVPDTLTSGTKIPYYCEPLPNLAHYQIGMTGILRIV